MKILKILVFFFLLSCQTDNDRFQMVITGEPTNIDETGATLNGKIINSTDEAIDSYGFQWGIAVDFPNRASQIVFTEAIKEGGFSKRIESGLFRETVYFARAFVIKNKNIISGETAYFKSMGSYPRK